MSGTITDPNARRKTAKERAQELVDAKDRKIDRLNEKKARLVLDLTDVERDLDLAKRRRAFLASDPVLTEDAAQMSIDDEIGAEAHSEVDA